MLWMKFRLLLWKNSLIQLRHPWLSLLELLIPVLFTGTLIMLRMLVHVYDYPDEFHYPPVRIDSLAELRANISKDDPIDYRLAYSPQHPVLDAFVQEVAKDLGLLGFVAAANASELERIVLQKSYLAGISFQNDTVINDTELTHELRYALRFPGELRCFRGNPLLFNWQTDKSIPTYQDPGPRTSNHANGGIPPGYVTEGFLPLQHAIARHFWQAHSPSNETLMPDVVIRRYPHPGFRMDRLINGLETFLPIVIVVAFIYPCINITKFIALEKERQLKETMQIMGLPGWLHWAGWAVRALPSLFVSAAVIVAVLKVPWYEGTAAIMSFSDWTVLLLFMFVYSLTTVAFCFMMSVFFTRANVAAAIAGIVWFALYLIYQFVDGPDDLLLVEQMLLSLFSNTGMAFGILLVLRFEASGQGLHWANLFRPYSVDSQLTVGHVLGMMMVSSLLYLLIALYVEQIRPGDYGVPRPWYFPVMPSFWRNKPADENDVLRAMSQDAIAGSLDPKDFEAVSADRWAGVRICGLHKRFGGNVAVHPMTLDMYKNQITVLLGHNGAGKTTTISMLTGMITPTKGTALVNGYDIRSDISGVRNSLGMCPQHNILFDDLTVREHLEFFMRLKGISDTAHVHSEIERYLQLIGLTKKADTRSSRLSGGMKRKLAVCVAFCGGSKVVFCDEPSSGMDPAARHALWEFIRQEKRGRTVLLTTHFMDEADMLGDRIAILNAGELKCCGSSYFLKKRYGVGYRLICTKNGLAEELTKTETLTQMLQQFDQEVTVAYESRTELAYNLPDALQERFEELFVRLEDDFAIYGLSNFGVSLTTLEDVFMNVGADSIKTETNGVAPLMVSDSPSNSDRNVATFTSLNTLNFGSSQLDFEEAPLTGIRLWASQSVALFNKRFHQSLRSWPLLMVQLTIPSLFVIATVLIERNRQNFGDLPALRYDMNMYDSPITLLQVDNAVDPAAVRFNEEYTNRLALSGDELQTIHEPIDRFILAMSETSLAQVNQEFYVGAHINANGSQATAWFNNQPYHALPLSLSLLHDALLGSGLGPNYRIEVTNAPLPYVESTRVEMIVQTSRMGLTLGLNISFAMSFVIAFFVLPIVREQANRAKLLQFVSGAKVLVYWGTAFLWDFAVFIGISVLLVAVFVGFQETGWSTWSELGRLFVALLAFGYAALPVTYLCGRWFMVPTAAFTVITILFVLSAVVLPITVQSLLLYNEHDVADVLGWILMVLPHYALNTCLRYMHEITQMRRVCEIGCEANEGCTMDLLCKVRKECCESQFWRLEQPGMGVPLLYLAVVGTLGLLLNMCIELRWFEAIWYVLCGRNADVSDSSDPVGEAEPTRHTDVDADVCEERERVQNMSTYERSKQCLVVRDMRKNYGKFQAVKGISIALEGGECFGLLGINGAGKTSTFKMLTGDIRISSGHAWVRGIPLRTRMNSVHKRIGYCPQFDALIDEMTCRQIVSLFCRLRGIPPHRIAQVIDNLADTLNFRRHLDKQARACSGGNRRKLSTAVALIGRPSVVYLDEPTTGMDPGAKRHLWDVLIRQRRAGTAIVLTSHSMDECEALCTRLAIMVNGVFRCLGSVQHLKSKFAHGFTLMIKVRSDADESPATIRVKAFVLETFAGAVLINQFHGLLTYAIPNDPPRKWSTMFGQMNAAKRRFDIDDYALNQTSLEQVFLSFTEDRPPMATTVEADASETTANYHYAD